MQYFRLAGRGLVSKPNALSEMRFKLRASSIHAMKLHVRAHEF